MRFGRLAAVATAGLVGIASATGIISERPPVSTKQISADINNALAKAGLDASESEKIRQVYHVGVGQIDDESDESRQALSGALSKILASDTVKHINADINHVVDIASSITERDLDASAGSAPIHGGAAAHHETVTVFSDDPADDPAYLVWAVKAWELMAVGPGANQDTERIGPLVWKLQKLFPAYNITPSAVDNKTNTTLDAPTDCDCKKVIASVIEPKPEDGMSQAWFVEWKKAFYPQGNLSTRCIKTCVDHSIHDFIKKIKEFQAAEELSNKPVAEVHAGGLDKREESNVTATAADIRENMRKIFPTPSPEVFNFWKKMNEKLRELPGSPSPETVSKMKDFAEHMREMSSQRDEKALLTYRQWKESWSKWLNKVNETHTADHSDEGSVSSSGGSEEGGVLVR